MKKHRKPMLAVLCFMAVLLLCGKLSLNTLAAASDTAYQGIKLGYIHFNAVGPKVKVGKYYLWMESAWEYGYEGGTCLKVAKSKSAKGATLAKAPKGYNGYIAPVVASNGEKVYYIICEYGKEKYSLMQANLATRKSTLVKNVFKENANSGVQHAYGKYVYFETVANGPIVRLDTKTKKTKTIVSGVGFSNYIMLGKGRYMYISTRKGSEDEKYQVKILVYDCKSGKLRTIDKKDCYCRNELYFYKDKIYLAQLDDTSHLTIYSFNPSGSGKKVFLKPIKINNDDSYSLFFDEEYFYYRGKDNSCKRVNLNTKKVQKISKKQFESKRRLKYW